MSTTFIVTRIDNGLGDSSQLQYASGILRYTNSPEVKENQKFNPDKNAHGEKCIASLSLNFSKPVMSPDEMALEMDAELSLSRRMTGVQGVEHWVMSFEGDIPPVEDIFKGAQLWLEGMGYGGEDRHKINIAIHDDTEHRHAHIVFSRYDSLKGKVNDRRGDFIKSGRSCAIVGDKMKWDRPENSKKRFKIDKKAPPIMIEEQDELTGKISVRYEPKVIETLPEDISEKAYSPGSGAEKFEHYSGLKSDLRLLHDRIAEAYAGFKDRLPKMKWGQIHLELARHGVQMDRREHEKKGVKKYGIVFSLDGENWVPAYRIFPAMTWDRLNGHIGAKKDSWRHANDEALKVLAEYREEAIAKSDQPGAIEAIRRADDYIDFIEKIHDEVNVAREKMPETEVTKKSEEDIFLSKVEVDALRKIPVEDIRKVFKESGIELYPSGKKKVRNAIDVAMIEARLPYAKAIIRLAEYFPDVIKKIMSDDFDDAVAQAKMIARESGDDFKKFEKSNFHHAAGREVARFFKGVQAKNIDFPYLGKRGMTLPKIVNAVPELVEWCKNIEDIYCSIKLADGRIGFMIEECGSDFLKRCPANCVVENDGKKCGYWIIDKKYSEPKFYDDFLKFLQQKNHNVKNVRGAFLPKFFVPKDGFIKIPKAHVENFSTRKAVEFEALIEDFRIHWKNENSPEISSRPVDVDYRTLLDRFRKDVQRERIKIFAKRLKRVFVPPWIRTLGQRLEESIYFSEEEIKPVEMKKAVAKNLFVAGANPDEVYSFFADKRRPKPGTVSRGRSGAEDLKDREIVASMSPENVDMECRWRNRRGKPKVQRSVFDDREADLRQRNALRDIKIWYMGMKRTQAVEKPVEQQTHNQRGSESEIDQSDAPRM